MSDGEQDRLDAPWGLLIFFAALLAFDILMPLLFPLTDPLSNTIQADYFGFLLGQVGLHAALVVLWQGWLRLRMASILLGTVLGILHMSQQLQAMQHSAPIFVIQWVLIALAMLGLGVMGWELQRWTPQQLADANPRRTQVSLLGLGVLVTVACILAAIANQVDWGVGVSADILAPVLLAMQTVLLVAGVLMPRAMKSPALLWLVLAFSIGGMWVLFGILQGFIGPKSWQSILLLFLLPALFQTLVLLAMRLAGYRLWRLGPNLRELQMRRDAEAARVAPPIAPSPFLDSTEAQKSGSIADPNG